MVSFPVVLHMVKDLVQYTWMMCLVLEVNHPSLSVLTVVIITVDTMKMFLFNANVTSSNNKLINRLNLDFIICLHNMQCVVLVTYVYKAVPFKAEVV